MTTVKLTGNFLAAARCLIFSDGGGVSWSFNPNTNVLTASATAGGTFLSSVGLADQSSAPIYSISNSPLNANGTLTLTLNTQAASTIFAGPTTGAAAQPTFRALVAADLPNNGANPAASVGLSAVNGTATTWMRSDGAPALSVSISPTWSGAHTFSNAPVMNAGLNTFSGNTGSIGSGSATTIKTLPNGSTGMGYLVFASLNAGAGTPSLYSAAAIINVSGTAATIATLLAGTNLSITLSGLNVQVTQTSGATQATGVTWIILRIY